MLVNIARCTDSTGVTYWEQWKLRNSWIFKYMFDAIPSNL